MPLADGQQACARHSAAAGILRSARREHRDRYLLASASRSKDAEARIDARARRLVEAISRPCRWASAASRTFCTPIRCPPRKGLALMVLAEALLRVPDAETADRLIEDKLKAGDWAHHGDAVDVASGVGFGLDAWC